MNNKSCFKINRNLTEDRIFFFEGDNVDIIDKIPQLKNKRQYIKSADRNFFVEMVNLLKEDVIKFNPNCKSHLNEKKEAFKEAVSMVCVAQFNNCQGQCIMLGISQNSCLEEFREEFKRLVKKKQQDYPDCFFIQSVVRDFDII